MAAKYVIQKGLTGRFHFNLVANGQTIATSQSYESKDSAKAGIESVRASAGDAEVVDET